METAPKLSVCIPAFAQPSYLVRALESLAEQDFDDFEVVISDDSPDDVLERVADSFRSRLRILYHRNQERLGPAANCNQSVDLATGELIKVLHHDDWLFEPDCLRDWVQLLDSRPDADFAFSASLAFDCRHKDGALLQRLSFCHQATRCQLKTLENDTAFLFEYNLVGAPSATIFRKRISSRFDERLMYLVDIDFYLSVLAANPRFSYSRRPLVAVTGGTDVPGKVTDYCRTKDSLLVFEWVYTYCKLLRTHGFREECFRALTAMLRRYGVSSEMDLRSCGVDFAIPLHLGAWIWGERFVRRPIRRVARLVRKRSRSNPRPGSLQ